MENVSFVYTLGMDEDEVEAFLSQAETGVLSLAREGEAYGLPVHVHYEDGAVYLRLGKHEGSEKFEFMESTTRASLVVYGSQNGESWSVMLRGDLVQEGDAPMAETNEWFGPMRVFGEAVQDLEPVLFRFDADEVSGRRTSDEDGDGKIVDVEE